MIKHSIVQQLEEWLNRVSLLGLHQLLSMEKVVRDTYNISLTWASYWCGLQPGTLVEATLFAHAPLQCQVCICGSGRRGMGRTSHSAVTNNFCLRNKWGVWGRDIMAQLAEPQWQLSGFNSALRACLCGACTCTLWPHGSLQFIHVLLTSQIYW